MKSIYYFSVTFLLIFLTVTIGNTFEINKCYPINGPANIRAEPDGKKIDTIEHGKIVRIKDQYNSKWLKIEYMFSHKNLCPIENHKKLETGWTHKNNLAKGAPLIDLIKNGKVIIAKEIHLQETINRFLYEPIEFRKRYEALDGNLGDSKTIKLNSPVKINVYSLDGKIQYNEIDSFVVTFDAGLDSFNLQTKSPLPKGQCVIVNGFINEFGINKESIVSNQKNIFSLNLFPEARNTKWVIAAGDLNNDGIRETILNEVYIDGAYGSHWYIYQQGKLSHIKRYIEGSNNFKPI